MTTTAKSSHATRSTSNCDTDSAIASRTRAASAEREREKQREHAQRRTSEEDDQGKTRPSESFDTDPVEMVPAVNQHCANRGMVTPTAATPRCATSLTEASALGPDRAFSGKLFQPRPCGASSGCSSLLSAVRTRTSLRATLAVRWSRTGSNITPASTQMIKAQTATFSHRRFAAIVTGWERAQRWHRTR